VIELEILEFKPEVAGKVMNLLNRHFGSELVYNPFDEVSFKHTFLDSPHFRANLTFVATDEGKVIGFANGVFIEKSKVAYITMVIVDKVYCKQGIGSKLLEALENTLKACNPIRIDCSFFNPINLIWNVPNTNKHQHPNSPGVDVSSDAYQFFMKHHYQPMALQNSYYLDLAKYTLPQEIQDKIDILKEKGISFEYFDKDRHEFKDLFDKLGNELWREACTNAVYGKDPKPVLVPVYQNQAIGFTGPIYPQENGRGFFAGIGVHPDFRAEGVGKSLFFLLCKHEKELGAKYMTLFTGDSNPARRMYEAAGFKIVKSWQVMRKTEL
jgi:ribosomal protein S18 acetylase RimI-like enzyme